MQKIKALFIKYFNIVVAFILFFSLSINCFAMNGIPTTEHFPDGYKYYICYNDGTCKNVAYFKTLPYVYFLKTNDSYLEINMENSAIATLTFYSDTEREYHFYTEAFHSKKDRTVSTNYNQRIQFHKNDLVYSNFTIKTQNESGTTYKFVRVDDSLEDNYESVSEGYYETGKGEYEEVKQPSVIEAILSIPTKIIEFFQGIFEKILDALSKIVDFVVNFFQNFIDFMKSLFIPREGFIQEQLTNLKARFMWFDRVIKFASDFMDMIQAVYYVEPPAMNVDLSKLNSKYWSVSGTVNILDLSWFEPYKKSSDTIISAILWMCFFWRIYLRIPDILQGSGSMVSDYSEMEYKLSHPKRGGKKK